MKEIPFAASRLAGHDPETVIDKPPEQGRSLALVNVCYFQLLRAQENTA